MTTQIKHMVLVTLKEEMGEPQQIFLGEYEKDLPDCGARKAMQVRITSITNVKDLIMGKSVPVKYLLKERRDLHKEWLTWPQRFAFTKIDNGIIDKNNGSDSIQTVRIDALESEIIGYRSIINDLRDFIENIGEQTLDSQITKIKAYLRHLRDIPEKEKNRVVREEEKKNE